MECCSSQIQLMLNACSRSYVAAAYVKWIEAAGGRAVPIRWDAAVIHHQTERQHCDMHILPVEAYCKNPSCAGSMKVRMRFTGCSDQSTASFYRSVTYLTPFNVLDCYVGVTCHAHACSQSSQSCCSESSPHQCFIKNASNGSSCQLLHPGDVVSIMQGGLTDLWLDDPYVLTAKKLIAWATEENEAGKVFPVSIPLCFHAACTQCYRQKQACSRCSCTGLVSGALRTGRSNLCGVAQAISKCCSNVPCCSGHTC